MLQKLITGAAFILSVFTANAQGLKTPAASPTQTIKQDFGISSIELVYSRPGMKGRKIFGDLVPFGKVWRTGANAATRIKFADDVLIGGKPLKAGEYAVYTIPNQSDWEVIINKGVTNWGTEYKQSEDVLRMTVKSKKTDQAVETFTMQFANVKPASTELELMWDKTLVTIPISTDIDGKVMTQINNLMTKDTRPYFQAAQYYMENGKDMKQALAWFDKAVELQPNAYWIHYQRANALAKVGRKQDAKVAAQRSMDLAKEQKNDDYVRMNETLLADLK